MGSKRKNAPTPTTSSWNETKSILPTIDHSHWFTLLKQCDAINVADRSGVVGESSQELLLTDHTEKNETQTRNLGIMDDMLQEMLQSSRQAQESLQTEIEQERKAFASESDHLYRIVHRTNELESQVSEQIERIAQLEEMQVQLRASIHHEKSVASKYTEEMDLVEFDRMHQVPKIKNQISLYARTTGIKWDYHREHVLAGQIAIPSLGVVSRFSIDPREHDSFQIANYLWSAMEGNVAPDIRVT